jgi:hypothetical protein
LLWVIRLESFLSRSMSIKPKIWLERWLSHPCLPSWLSRAPSKTLSKGWSVLAQPSLNSFTKLPSKANEKHQPDIHDHFEPSILFNSSFSFYRFTWKNKIFMKKRSFIEITAQKT